MCYYVEGTSAGLVSEVRFERIAGNLPDGNLEISPTDLNGNGMGDWLIHSLDGDEPLVYPVYNQARLTDFLSWTHNPMGLKTQVFYAALSDHSIYHSNVKWDEYRSSSKDTYEVIAAPNLWYHPSNTQMMDRSIVYQCRTLFRKRTMVLSSTNATVVGKGFRKSAQQTQMALCLQNIVSRHDL